jgi:hypothetical protein
MGDKGLDQISTGFAEFLGATEISGIALDQSRIELMLADQQAKPVTKTWLAIA